MTFPQPSAAQYTVSGGDFFRLNTPLASPGDMYQSEVSGLAMALGPESDIANVNVAYFDDQAANKMQFAQVSPSRSLVGRIDANNLGTYSPTQQPGKVLIWPADLYDPNYRPRAFNSLTDSITFVTPVLDIIQYFNQQPSLISPRVDKTYEFQNYAITGGTLYIVVPYYGRKYCYVNFTNREPVIGNTFGILGVNFAITQDTTPSTAYHQETVIRAPAVVTTNNSATVRIGAGLTGMFDVLVFSVNAAGPAPLRIVVSDESQGN